MSSEVGVVSLSQVGASWLGRRADWTDWRAGWMDERMERRARSSVKGDEFVGVGVMKGTREGQEVKV